MFRTFKSSEAFLPEEPLPLEVGSNFTSDDAGKTEGSANGPPLLPGAGLLAINGATNLQSTIVGEGDAFASTIYIINKPAISHYRYSVYVQARGPSIFRYFRLYFTDETGDTYKLKIWKDDLRWHFVNYNSDAPGIIAVNWDGE